MRGMHWVVAQMLGEEAVVVEKEEVHQRQKTFSTSGISKRARRQKTF